MTRFVEGIFKLLFGVAAFYLVLKHWVGGTRLMKEGALSMARIYVSITEPAQAARRIL